MMKSRVTFRAFTLIFCLAALIGFTQARQLIVRVQAPDYQTVYQHIPFKGTSIEIAGAIPGSSYDLLLEEEDLSLVLNSGLKSEILIPTSKRIRFKPRGLDFTVLTIH